MKTPGTLTVEQSRFLGGVLNSPYFEVFPLRESVLALYLESESGELIPQTFPEEVQKTVQYAVSCAEKAAEMPVDATPEEIIFATENPFEEANA